MNNRTSFADRARATVSSVKTKAAAVGTGLLVAAGSASAQAFDSSSIVTKIEGNALLAVGIIGAMILAGWGLRSMGLLRGRG